MGEYLLEVKNLKKTYPIYRNTGKLFGSKERMNAVDGMSFYIKKGETYGLVGESGCGKSTSGRAIVGLSKTDSGSIFYEGTDLCSLSEKEFRPFRKEIQMVFQNTLSALNPRQRIGSILEDILFIHGVKDREERRNQAVEVLRRVGLEKEYYFRFPHELSGGQVQRLGIASALVVQPKLIVCDEPVSALDGVVRFISDRVGVMYLGTLVEEAETEELFSNPLHPYTKALLAAALDPYVSRKTFVALKGEQPIRTENFVGCAFYSRCPYAAEQCKKETPVLQKFGEGHKAACHRATEF